MVKRRQDKPQQHPLYSGLLEAFQKNQAALRHYISRFVRRTSDIDDVAQEAFMRAYRAESKSGEPLEQPKSYLFRVAHNVAVSELQKKSNQIVDCLEEIDDLSVPWIEETLEDQLMAAQTVGMHCEAVASLPAQCRRVYLMRKVHGMSHREIAEGLGIKQSTVEKHISKGIRDCSRYIRLCQEGEDPNHPDKPSATTSEMHSSFSGGTSYDK